MRKLVVSSLFASSIMVASCAPVDNSPVPLTAKQNVKLEKLLKGKVAGEPVNCISNYGRDGLERISDSMVVYRASGRTVYVNNLNGNCSGLATGNDIIVTKTFGGQLCRNDTLKLVDSSTGFPGTICSLGAFTPYSKPKS